MSHARVSRHGSQEVDDVSWSPTSKACKQHKGGYVQHNCIDHLPLLLRSVCGGETRPFVVGRCEISTWEEEPKSLLGRESMALFADSGGTAGVISRYSRSV